MTLRSVHGVAKIATLWRDLYEEIEKVLQSSYHVAVVCVTYVFWTSISKGKEGTLYIAKAMGSTLCAPSRDCSVLPATYNSGGAEIEFRTTKLNAGQFILIFLAAKLRLRQLKVFFSSIRRTLSFSGFPYWKHREWIACSILQFWPRQSCMLLPKKWRSFSFRLMMHLPMMRWKNFPDRLGRILGFLFIVISLHALFGSRDLSDFFKLPDEQEF